MNIYDQLKQLWARVTDLTKNGAAADTKIAALEAAAVRIPKDYSTTETATGQNWIDGKPIYMVSIAVLVDDTQKSYPISAYNMDKVVNITGSYEITVEGELNGITRTFGFAVSSTSRFTGFINGNKSSFVLMASGTANAGNGYVTIYYTKATAPSKSPDEEPETKATKAAKKKASK